MSRIVLDAELKRKLPRLDQTSSIEDEQGNVLGHLVPEREYQRLLYSDLFANYPCTKDEMDAIRNDSEEFTFQDVLDRLRSA